MTKFFHCFFVVLLFLPQKCERNALCGIRVWIFLYIAGLLVARKNACEEASINFVLALRIQVLFVFTPYYI